MPGGQARALGPCGPTTMRVAAGYRLHSRIAGTTWLTGSLGGREADAVGSRTLRNCTSKVTDPVWILSIIAQGPGTWPAQSTLGSPMDTMWSTMTVVVEYTRDSRGRGTRDKLGARPGWLRIKTSKSQGADCFLIYVVCSTRLIPEATQLKPQRGPN